MQTFVYKQYALEAWEMQVVFAQTCYVNVNSRHSKDGEITSLHVKFVKN